MCVCHPQIIPFICVQSNHVSSPVIPRINPWIVWKLDRVSLASYYIYINVYIHIYIHIYIVPTNWFQLEIVHKFCASAGWWLWVFRKFLWPVFTLSWCLLHSTSSIFSMLGVPPQKTGCYVQIHYQVLLVGGWMMVVTSPCGWVAVGDDSLCCLEVVWRLDGTCHQIP